MKNRNLRFCLAAVVILGFGFSQARGQDDSMPRIVKKDGRYALFVDGAPYLILGAQVNNSSGWPAVWSKVWPAMEFMHVNTVEVPIYWEQFEPEYGKFDYSVIDELLDQAREEKVHLVFHQP
jgi:beta-galactosidase GanA